MKDNFDACFKGMLRSEGGFVNHPKDPGGMTNLGVTKRVYESWVKREVTEKEMRDLKPADVRELYLKLYWEPCRCDELTWGVDYSVFDFAVNAGVKRSIITLQRCVGVKDDGIFGPGTMMAVKEAAPEEIIGKFFDVRIRFYQQLKNYETFGKGWHHRAATVSLDSKRMHEKHQAKDSKDSESSPSQ